MTVDRSIALFGTSEVLPERIVLTAGPVSATLENGALRWIRLNGVEVLRGVAFLVRDQVWDTAAAEISDLHIEQGDSGFRVTFNALCRTGDGELPWSAEIVGEPDGSLHFVGTARPAKDFVTNRTGFVVLHPLDGVVGCPVEITHVDGTKRRMRFPALVDPEQCFLNVRAIAHEVGPGLWATCTMEGDAWETEDHRSWLDASFKTYVRPLSLPYPYTLKGGEDVTQSVTLIFSGPMPKARKASAGDMPVEVTLDRTGTARMPLIGLRAPLPWMKEAQAAAALVRAAGPQLVNGRIDPRAGHGVNEMKALGDLASAVGAGLTLELVVPCRREPAAELADMAAQLKESGVRPESIVVAAAEDRIRQEPGPPPPPLALLGEIYRSARAAFPDAIIGGGTFCFFAELNRNWPPIGLIDYVTHMSCSVVHASDDRAMTENLESYQHIARTVRAFAGTTPYRAIATGIGLDAEPTGKPAPNPDNGRHTLSGSDPRHRGLFGAAWMLASIGELARAGATAVSPAELVGGAGIVHCRLPNRQPWFDTVDSGSVYPAFHVVSAMARAAGRACVEAASSDRTRIATLSFGEADGGMSLWLANLRDAPQQVVLPEVANARVARLDESTFEEAATDPAFLQSNLTALASNKIEIGAHGVVRIEIGG
jgi:D-apionolactonase